MGFKHISQVIVECDNCGAIMHYSDYTPVFDNVKEAIEDVKKNPDWVTDGRRVACADCAPLPLKEVESATPSS